MRSTRSKVMDVPKRVIGKMAETATNVLETISDIAEDPAEAIDAPVRVARRATKGRSPRGRASARRRRSKR